MNKCIKTTGLALLLAGSMTMFAGCGDNKPAANNNSSKSQVKQEQSAQAPKKKPVPTSKLYRFGVHIDDEKKIPTITPEITAEFEKAAANFELPTKNPKQQIDGIWVYKSSPLSKGAQIFTHWWTLNLDGHHASKFEYTDNKGKTKTAQEQHIGHIKITIDVKTNKIKEVYVSRYDLTEDNPKGASTDVSRQKF